MFNRVQKQGSVRMRPIFYRDNLLAALLFFSVKMPFYFSCEAAGLLKCNVSPQNFSYCVKCVRLKRFYYNVLGLFFKQFQFVSVQHVKLRAEFKVIKEKYYTASVLVKYLCK